MTRDDVVDRLITAREVQGLTQAEVAARIGVARSLLTQWELGYFGPPLPRLSAWAEALGYELRLELVGGPWIPPHTAVRAGG